jgi:hypothetical protein
MSKKKIKHLEHPNKDRVFKYGQIHDAKPSQKSHRIEVDEYTKRLAAEIRELIEDFDLELEDVYSIIYQQFGEGIGYHTTRLFLSKTYGPGFNLRDKTRRKYEYLLSVLRKKKKEFANPEE